MIRARIYPLHSCRDPRLLPQSKRHGLGSSGPSTAARGPETETATATSPRSGSAVLDLAAPVLVSLDGSSHHRQAEHGGGLASQRISTLLALAFSPAWWEAADQRRNSSPGAPIGRRESGLGSAKDPWGGVKLGF